MNVFSARTAKLQKDKRLWGRARLFPLFIVMGCVFAATFPAHANDRMAGGSRKTDIQTNGSSKAVPDKPDQTKYFRPLPERDVIYLESLGLVKKHDEGMIGTAMWSGSSYQDIYELVSALPLSSHAPRPLYKLQEFILTMRADSRLLDKTSRQNDDRNRTDLFTLRVEKLLQAGAFEKAAALYGKNILPPHNKRLAEAGILALLYTGKAGQACLEQQLLQNEDHSQNPSFWRKLENFCAVTLSKKTVRRTKNNGKENKKEEKDITKDIAGDVLAALSYRFEPETIQDILARPVLEKAILFGTGKIDYGRMSSIENPETLPLIDLAALIADENLPAQHRYALIPYGISTALIKKSDVTDFYASVDLPVDFENIRMAALDEMLSSLEGWHKLPFLHQLLIRITTEKSRLEILEKALSEGRHSDIAYLYPFAAPLYETGIGSVQNESLDIAASLLFLALENNEFNNINWKNTASRSADKKLPLSCFLEKETPDHTQKDNAKNSDKTTTKQEKHSTELCRIMFKLDKGDKLHNYASRKSYEKQSGLTFDGDYVMPFKDLADRLDEAVEKNRHAETVLSGILVFQSNGEGQEIPPELLEKTTDALSTVGLIEVSRAIVRNVIAGYEEQK